MTDLTGSGMRIQAMPTFTFEDYCEDFLDLHIALMSDEEKAAAYIGFKELRTKPAKKAPSVDTRLKSTVAVLTSQLMNSIRMMQSQCDHSNYFFDKSIFLALDAKVKAFFEKNGRKNKVDIIALLDEAAIVIPRHNAAREAGRAAAKKAAS